MVNKNKSLVHLIASVHVVLIVMNFVSIPLVVIKEPFWIWAPTVTFLVSPLLGGENCIFNKIENYYRIKANMPTIVDRTTEVWKTLICFIVH